jgi:hypothetical protein
MRLKREHHGGYLPAHSGARFARSLVQVGLTGEQRLLSHPVAWGAGERISRAARHRAGEHAVFSGGAVARVLARP